MLDWDNYSSEIGANLARKNKTTGKKLQLFKKNNLKNQIMLTSTKSSSRGKAGWGRKSPRLEVWNNRINWNFDSAPQRVSPALHPSARWASWCEPRRGETGKLEVFVGVRNVRYKSLYCPVGLFTYKMEEFLTGGSQASGFLSPVLPGRWLHRSALKHIVEAERCRFE